MSQVQMIRVDSSIDAGSRKWTAAATKIATSRRGFASRCFGNGGFKENLADIEVILGVLITLTILNTKF
jgi:hypothetical protein